MREGTSARATAKRPKRTTTRTAFIVVVVMRRRICKRSDYVDLNEAENWKVW